MTDKRHDRTEIDAVLLALRSAVPPAGLEDRVWARLKQAPAAHMPWWKRPAMRVPFATAALSVLLGAFAWTMSHHAVRENAPAIAVLPPSTVRVPRMGVREPPAKRSPTVRRADAAFAVQRGEKVAAPSPKRTAALPLTEQEELLLQLAGAQDQRQAALLDAATRQVQEAAEKAKVDAFFQPEVRERTVLITEFKPLPGTR